MDPIALAAIGALLVSAVGMSMNLIKSFREHRTTDIHQTADYIRARQDANLGSIEAAERVIKMYRAALEALQTEQQNQRVELESLREEVGQLREAIFEKDSKILALQYELSAQGK